MYPAEGLVTQARDLLAVGDIWLDAANARLRLVDFRLGAFHSSRLAIRASQVGRVAAARRDRRSTADRLALALSLLADPAYDALLTGESPFALLPRVMAEIASGSVPALCHTITYDNSDEGDA